jgi:hypothetical protein
MEVGRQASNADNVSNVPVPITEGVLAEVHGIPSEQPLNSMYLFKRGRDISSICESAKSFNISSR